MNELMDPLGIKEESKEEALTRFKPPKVSGLHFYSNDKILFSLLFIPFIILFCHTI